ncbi:MAG: peroxiredoxin family protein [Anaerolineae bacterium]
MCRNQLVELEKDRPKFEAKGAQIIALAYQNQNDARQSVAETGAAYPILADADHRVAGQYGVFNLLGDGVATPAVFIIGPNREILWSYIGANIADRPSNKTILENLPG